VQDALGSSLARLVVWGLVRAAKVALVALAAILERLRALLRSCPGLCYDAGHDKSKI